MPRRAHGGIGKSPGITRVRRHGPGGGLDFGCVSNVKVKRDLKSLSGTRLPDNNQSHSRCLKRDLMSLEFPSRDHSDANCGSFLHDCLAIPASAGARCLRISRYITAARVASSHTALYRIQQLRD